ncbi:ATP-binding cassette domain-containing protein [Clostridium sp. MSJ-4]|uniref:ATP-binding cassette domain-containing protein n=1 Tax=Clostridium simiarum TaxID=2841506 RepID=A0ABS6F6I5_9CLOT|nr:ATP-binding cassette domain-containing protein [Clostridium simiarum]MBU5593435.1 ATP-binding cassette domain-containing protein [Clostridium simiarum]
MIDMKNVNVSYGKEKALEEISLHIEKHSTYSIIGPSGCGKTTLLYTMAGLIKPNTGEVIIDHRGIDGVRKETGLILQDLGLLPWKTVWDNVCFTLKSRKVDKEEANIITERVLKDLGIYDIKNKYPGELSGGQKQRVAIGRTLALDTDLLLMDEPSSALDAMTKEHIQSLILKLYSEKKFTLVIVTHSIEEAAFLGEHIVIMEKKKIKNILKNPYFGKGDLRENIDFYKFCLEVRKCIYNGEGD